MEGAQEVLETAKFFWQKNSPNGGEDLEKVDFYNTLEDTLVSLPDQEYIFLYGDLNGHFGGWRQEIKWENGPFSFVNPNSDIRLLNFYRSQNLAVLTLF